MIFQFARDWIDTFYKLSIIRLVFFSLLIPFFWPVIIPVIIFWDKFELLAGRIERWWHTPVMRKVWDANSYIPLIFFGLLLPVTWPFLIVHIIIFDRCDTSNSITDIQQVQAQLKSTNTSTYVQHSH